MTTSRRLAAILAADVAGYSAAMERDEEGTAAAVRGLRRDVVEPKLAEHQGRLIKTTGDGFLAEFASPIAALNCALAIQQRPNEKDGLLLRIGLNLGDVIIEESGDVLEGSVRRAGNRVRITGQLIDAITGAHLWADRFESSLEHVFELQDEVTSGVIGALDPKLLEAEIARVKTKPITNLAAYDCFLRGMDFVHRWTHESNEEALRLFYRSIELDPLYAKSYAHAAWCLCWRKTTGIASEQDRLDAERLVSEALRLGKDDADSVTWAGFTRAVFAQNRVGLEQGAALLDRATELNPNFSRAWNLSGAVKVWLGQPELAIEHLQRAIRLCGDPTALQTRPKFFIRNVGEAIPAPHWSAGTIMCRNPEGNSMADVQVTCITKPRPDSQHEHITELGNPRASWKWTRERVIASIDSKENTFFTIDPRTGKRADIGVVRPTGRPAYVRTYADRVWNDNLLAMDQCPI